MSAKKDASSPASHEVSMASSGNRRLSAHEQHMKHIIHDANHCLMLIAIAGDQIERHIGQGQLTPDEGEGAGASARAAISILRQNVDVVSRLLSSLNGELVCKEQLSSLTAAQFHPFLQAQLQEWQLIVGGDIHISLSQKPFAGVVTVKLVALKRALLNLIINAMDALQDVDRPYKEIRISVRPCHHQLYIHIQDNDAGIADDFTPHMFQDGVSSKDPTTAYRGLGLPSTKKLVASWGGVLRYIPQPGQAGSHFMISAPLGPLQNDPDLF